MLTVPKLWTDAQLDNDKEETVARTVKTQPRVPQHTGKKW